MMYKIELVFLVFPLVCLFFAFTRTKTSTFVHVFLAISFIVLYSFSLNGSDFIGYQGIYERIGSGASFRQVHGEIGFYYLMKLSNLLGLSYVAFRVLLLSAISALLYYSLHKVSLNFPYSVFIVTSMFVIYTISAYRQYIVIVFSLMWIIKYCEGKRWQAIIGTAFLLLFHATAVLPLFCLLLHLFSGKQAEDRNNGFFMQNYIILIIVALGIRIFITAALGIKAVNDLISMILAGHSTANPTLLTFGLLSRLVMMFIISHLYCKNNSRMERLTSIIFWYYFISMFLYISVPLELVMGRLMNNANILIAILIPALMYEKIQDEGSETKILNKTNESIISFSIMTALAMIILINQLLSQDGYTPYMNILFGINNYRSSL